MIEFKGEISGKSKEFLLKRQVFMQFSVFLIIAIVFMIPVLLATFLLDGIAIICSIPLLTAVLLSLLPPTQKQQKLFVPQRIFLDLEEGTVVHQCEKMERFHMLDTVAKVLHYGEWYYLVFNYSDRDQYFVCQKDLLVRGTIEEFEALFEGKIERLVE